MDIGTQIKMCLVQIGKNQKWLSDETGIDYQKLNASINGSRSFSYQEFSYILWALDKKASDFIHPTNPTQKEVS